MTADKIGIPEVGALVGETVGNYRITDLLGQGGMGVVYRAEHVLLGKRAAVKVLLPERCSSREIVDRFFNEAKASSLIEDPGIVDIFDYGRLPDGNAYIVMELLEGESLGDRLKRLDRISANHAAAIARHIAGTLAAAHAHGIIHRDLKPDNIFLVRDAALPRGERAKLLDFGIAKLQSGTQPVEMVKTETGRLMGTPYYMSPEQCRGAGKIDQRTDIYSLGCVLYQMLTGRPPFVMEGAGEILAAHIHVPPLSPRTHEPSIPPALEAVVLRMLEKDPVRRYQSAEDAVEALNQAAMRFSGEEDAPEPSLNLSGVFRRPSKSSASAPAFTDATTLNSTAGDLARLIAADRPQPARLGRLWPWLVGGTLAAAAGAIFTMVVAGDRRENAAASAPDPVASERGAPIAETRPPVVAAPAPEPTPPPAVQDPIVRELEAAPVEETVRLLVTSRPVGAAVYRESDGVRLGKTPLEVRARRGRGEAVFILRRNGFRTERLAMPVDQDQERTVALRRGTSLSVPPGSRRPPPDAAPAGTTPPAAGEDGTSPRGVPEDTADSGQPGSGQPGSGDGIDGDAGEKTPIKEEPVKKRGKDDALDPFNLLRPSGAKKTDKKRVKKPADEDGDGKSQDGTDDDDSPEPVPPTSPSRAPEKPEQHDKE